MSYLRPFRLICALVLFCLLCASPSLLYAVEGGELPGGPAEGQAELSAGNAPFAQPAEAGIVVESPLPSGEDIFAEDAPVRNMPEQVTLRAEYQPAPSEPAVQMEDEQADAVQVELLPVLTMLADGKALGFDEAVSRFSEFQPFDRKALLRESGELWLHLALDNVAHERPGALWLDLGDQLPPGVEVWLSSDGLRWKRIGAEKEGVYSLAHAGNDGQALIRMDGMPGLWFSPALRPLSLVMQSPERLTFDFALAVLSLLGAVCFFLCLGLRGESRFWTFLLASAAAVQALWAVPATASGIGAGALPGIFAAGVALLMLPHIGRVLMRTRIHSPAADIFFMVLALLGVCAALLPLIPKFAWMARLLVLWPLAAVLCFLPSAVLLLRGIQGSLPFTMACLFMGGGALIALSGLPRGMEAPLWGTCVLFGPVFGLLCLIAASPARQVGERPERGRAEEPEEAAKNHELEALRESVKGTVEELLDEACRLDQALNRAGVDTRHVDIMARADGMVSLARKLSEKALDTPAPAALPGASESDFDLRQVIQSVFSSVFAEAEGKGLGLSWYVAPHLGRRYRGDKARLTALLSLLLSDSVRASSSGAVSLHVRRADSTHPGQLLFSVSDTGEGLPPHGRSSSLLARAWELASACNGELFVSSGAQGTELGFSLECTAYEEDGVTPKPVPGEAFEMPEGRKGRRNPPKLVIVASAGRVGRQMLAHYLGGLNFRVWEAASAAEAAGLYAVEAASLIVFDSSLAEDDMVQALAAVRMHEGEHTLPAVPFLLIAKDALQAERMGKAGCDEALLPPLVRKDLRAMAKWLTAASKSLPRPELSSQGVTLAAVLAGASTGNLRFQRKGSLRPLRAEQPVPAVEKKAPAAEPAAMQSAPIAPPAPAESAEMLDAPVERIMQGLDALKAALEELDAYSVRRGAVLLAALAEGYGMQKLADMARCFRAAWEEGDTDAAAQIVEEMRAEASRDGKIV